MLRMLMIMTAIGCTAIVETDAADRHVLPLIRDPNQPANPDRTGEFPPLSDREVAPRALLYTGLLYNRPGCEQFVRRCAIKQEGCIKVRGYQVDDATDWSDITIDGEKEPAHLESFEWKLTVREECYSDENFERVVVKLDRPREYRMTIWIEQFRNDEEYVEYKSKGDAIINGGIRHRVYRDDRLVGYVISDAVVGIDQELTRAAAAGSAEATGKSGRTTAGQSDAAVDRSASP